MRYTRHVKPHHYSTTPSAMGDLYGAARTGEHLTRDLHPDFNLAFKAISGVGLLYLGYKQTMGAWARLMERLETQARCR